MSRRIMVKSLASPPLPLARGWKRSIFVLLLGTFAAIHILDTSFLNGFRSSPRNASAVAKRLEQNQTQESGAPVFVKARIARATGKIADDSPKLDHLCAQLSIPINLTNFTLPFTKGALEWMVNAAFSSLKNQTSTRAAWPSSWQAVVIVADNTANGTLLKEHNRLVDATLTEPIRKLQDEGVHVYMTTKNDPTIRSLEQLVKENPQCAWVTRIRLDADDILAPGYIEYISNHVIPNELEGTSTARGEPWLGALVASRGLNKLVLGKGVCEASFHQGNIFSGYSVGQAGIVPVSVFATLGHKIVGGAHTALGQRLRNEVAHKVLNDTDYFSRAGSLPTLNKITNRKEKGFKNYNKEYDHIDAARSRVMILDVNPTFGRVHPYLITPLSGHFPWGDLNKLPACNTSKMEEIKTGFGYSMDFAFAAMKAFETVELIDACRSNSFFRAAADRLFSSDKEDCFQMAQRRANATVKRPLYQAD